MKAITQPERSMAQLEAGAALAISISGGKDSQAMVSAVLRLRAERGWSGPVFLIHADLGRIEWRQTPGQCQKLADAFGLELVTMRRKDGVGRWDMVDRWIEQGERHQAKGKTPRPWSGPGQARFCTAELKRDPIDRYLRKYSNVVCAVGIRKEEGGDKHDQYGKPIGRAAAKAEQVRSKIDNTIRTATTWHPLLDWTVADVLEECGTSVADLGARREQYAQGKVEEALDGWPLHPAYVFGNERLSCQFCVLACKGDLANGARHNPELLEELISIEDRFGFTFQADRSLKEFRPAAQAEPEPVAWSAPELPAALGRPAAELPQVQAEDQPVLARCGHFETAVMARGVIAGSITEGLLLEATAKLPCAACRRGVGRPQRITYLSGAVRDEFCGERENLGFLMTPLMGNHPERVGVHAHDNGVFTEMKTHGKKPFDLAKFLAHLDKWAPHRHRALFAVAPDVIQPWQAKRLGIKDTRPWAATIERSLPILPLIRARGYRAALVAQNGLEWHMDRIPWDAFDVLFMGGGRDPKYKTKDNRLGEWKWSAGARRLIAEARRRGKDVHVGRVNTEKRFRQAQAWGATSADGTLIAFGPDFWLPQLQAWEADMNLGAAHNVASCPVCRHKAMLLGQTARLPEYEAVAQAVAWVAAEHANTPTPVAAPAIVARAA